MSDIGVYGLAVMGCNLALNGMSKGLKVSLHNRSPGRVETTLQQAEAEGLDAGTTFTAALWRLAKQLREELPRTKTQDYEASRPIKANGLDHREGSRSNRVNAE